MGSDRLAGLSRPRRNGMSLLAVPAPRRGSVSADSWPRDPGGRAPATARARQRQACKLVLIDAKAVFNFFRCQLGKRGWQQLGVHRSADKAEMPRTNGGATMQV